MFLMFPIMCLPNLLDEDSKMFLLAILELVNYIFIIKITYDILRFYRQHLAYTIFPDLKITLLITFLI